MEVIMIALCGAYWRIRRFGAGLMVEALASSRYRQALEHAQRSE